MCAPQREIERLMAKRLALIAGTGRLVEQSAFAGKAKGLHVKIFSMGAELAELVDFESVEVSPARPVELIWKLRSFRPDEICMVGAVSLSDSDRGGLLKVISMFRPRGGDKSSGSGDGALSRGIPVMEKLTGGRVIGVHTLIPDLAVQHGYVAGPHLDKNGLELVQFALDTAYQCGGLDLGQSVIVSRGRVIAIEDVAGTDALIGRVLQHRNEGHVNVPRSALALGKALKPNQSTRVDMPTIGPNTLTNAHQSGVGLIAIHADHTLLVDAAEFGTLAADLGISVVALLPSNSMTS